MDYTIYYTKTFEQLVELCVQHLAPFTLEEEVLERVFRAIERFEFTLAAGSEAAPVSPYLSTLGVFNYREFNVDGFRILYRHDRAADAIIVVLFCSQKQDLITLLVDYCLIYK